jgi:hypothetical protein
MEVEEIETLLSNHRQYVGQKNLKFFGRPIRIQDGRMEVIIRIKYVPVHHYSVAVLPAAEGRCPSKQVYSMSPSSEFGSEFGRNTNAPTDTGVAHDTDSHWIFIPQ